MDEIIQAVTANVPGLGAAGAAVAALAKAYFSLSKSQQELDAKQTQRLDVLQKEVDRLSAEALVVRTKFDHTDQAVGEIKELIRELRSDIKSLIVSRSMDS